MRRIKVLQLAEDLKLGGMEKVVYNIASGLNIEKFDPEVWCIARGGNVRDSLIEKGYDVPVLGISTYFNPFNIIKLAFAIRRCSPDIVHTHGYFASVMGRLAAKMADTKGIVTHVHSTYWNYTRRNLCIEKLLSRLTDRIICCSKAVEEFVIENEGVDTRKVVTIYDGVDKKEVASNIFSVKEELGINSSDTVITSVGSLFPHKGHKYLLEALSKVARTHRNFKCVLVGDGPLRNELENYAKAMGIYENVSFLGERRDVYRIIGATDIFVMPSVEREGLGIAVLEAMAYSKPVIASRIGGIQEAVADNLTGFLVDPADVETMSLRISELMLDTDKRITLGREGMAVFEKKFRLESMISKLEDLYESIIAGKA